MSDRTADGATGPETIAILSGLVEIADRYDGFILDLWGVLHDGERPYPGVIECLERLRSAGKQVCLLSNAPRRCASVVRKLEGMGIGRDLYTHVLTSGEATFDALRDPPDAWHAALGRALLHLGPERDTDIYQELDYEVVPSVEAADFVLNTGIDSYDETVADHEATLAACAARRLPMVCANPDLVVMIGSSMAICAGMLALRYEEMGGDVRYHGKPHAPVYRRCFSLMGIADPRRILAVGDSLRTDVAGANAAGIDALLVTGGIHMEELGTAWGERPDPSRLARIVTDGGQRPTAAIPHLVW